ncbi:MAG: LemA family protein [Candidatus Yanofskybacteria bacterium GW2011_GWA2_44_9]|nr:MAG: LemA family protein [Candidatus Yanofskybacteria bacterium GW2011_GWA2_44_9]
MITLAVVIVVVLWLVGAYNGLIRSRNRARESWADIDVQLKRRYDLIPNLVEAVKGYASHEQKTLDMVIQARSKAMGAKTVAEHAQAENVLTGALKSLFALSEAYPQLRAVESFAKLQDELSDTENKIQAARRFYNTNVMTLNTMIEQFPTNLIAGRFGFKKEEFFQLENDKEREPVKVSF